MNTKKIATELRLKHWVKIMQDRTASGMNVKEYCKQAGFHENTYFYWQRKIREAICKGLIQNPKTEPSEPCKRNIPPGWALYNPNAVPDKGTAITVEINKFKININPDIDTELLSKICRVLNSI